MVKHWNKGNLKQNAVLNGKGWMGNMSSRNEEPFSKSNRDSRAKSSLESKVVDALDDNWVDRSAPLWAKPYLRLMRADRPIGFWLLFWPCAWSLTLGSIAEREVWLNLWFFRNLILFLLGAIVMRGGRMRVE